MTIDQSTTALLVVDILQGADGDTVYGNDLAPAEEHYRAHAKRVVDACRAAKVPVLFACDAHLPGIDHELALWGEHGMADTPGAEPAAFLEPREGDYVIRKRRYDAFFDTSLDITLRELGVRTVVIIGCDTNICVRHTAAGAYYRCYDVVVPADATYTFLYGTQDEGEQYLERIYGARVVSSDELCAALA